MVAVLGQPVGLDGVPTLVELRVPVVHLRAHEPVEEVEALAHRPARERARRAHLDRRGLVPLADRRRAVAVAAEDLRDRRGAGRSVAVVAGLRRRHLARDAHPDRVVVAPGHQRLPGRRAQRRHVEPAVAQPLVGQPLRGRHLARAAVRRRRPEAHVVDEHDDHVGAPSTAWTGRIGLAVVSTSSGSRVRSVPSATSASSLLVAQLDPPARLRRRGARRPPGPGRRPRGGTARRSRRGRGRRAPPRWRGAGPPPTARARSTAAWR